MVSLVVFFLILSCGSVFCAVFYQKRYEEVVPVTASFIVLLLFLCGVCGNLRSGVFLVCTIAAFVYLAAVVGVLRRKCLWESIKNIVTPAFLLFFGLFIMLALLDVGKMPDGWDEFSHWADIVKIMVIMDDFGTNPQSNATFSMYPPGMALIQYFVQKLYHIFQSGDFSEWRLYFTYQIFFWTFFLPFFKGIGFKKCKVGFVYAVVFFLSPLLFYQGLYTKIYIDPILGILSGTGMAAVFLEGQKDKLYSTRVLLTCSMLVLAKDAGLLFAVLLGIAYILDCLAVQKYKWKVVNVREVFGRVLCIPCGW